MGLANVDNTSDANKPISTATQAALDTKVASTDIDTIEQVTQAEPTGLADLREVVTGVYERDFENGKILVNISGTARTITLAGAMTDLVDGVSKASVTVGAWDTVFLQGTPTATS